MDRKTLMVFISYIVNLTIKAQRYCIYDCDVDYIDNIKAAHYIYYQSNV